MDGVRGSCLPLSPIVPLLVALWWMVCEGPLVDGVRGSCLPLSSIVPLLVALWWMVCEGPLVDGVRGSCLPLSPIVPLLVALPFGGWCARVLWWMVCEGLVSLCLPLYPFLLPFGGWCARVLSPFVSHCTPSCCPLMDGVRESCLPLSPIVPLLVALWWMVCEGLVSLCLPLYPFLLCFGGWCARVLFPFVFHCAPSCCPPVYWVRGSCLPLSSIVPLLVALWWMVCESLVSLCLPLYPFLLRFGGWCARVLSPFVSHCALSCCPLVDGVRGSCFPLSSIVPLLIALWWMVCESLVSLCLPLYPFLLRFGGWCARVLSPFVFHCAPSCCPLVDGARVLFPLPSIVPLFVALWWMVCEGLVSLCLPLCPFLLRFGGWCARVLSPFVFHCAPSCCPLVDGVRGSCFPLSSIVPLLVALWWMVCEGLVSLCLPLCPFLLPFGGWCARVLSPFVFHCAPSCCPLVDGVRGSCLPLSPIVPLLVALRWMVCEGPWWMVCEGLVSLCLPLCPFLLLFGGWCARVLFPFVFHCTPSCCPLVDGVRGSCSLCLPLYPFLLPFGMVCEGLVSPCLPLCPFLLRFGGWCARVLSPFVSHCTPFCCALVDGVRGSCFPLSSIVPLLVALWWMVCEGLVSLCLPLCPFLLPYGGWCARVLSPFVSHCTPFCCALVDGVRGSCFPLSSIVPLLVALWWMVCEGLVSLCLPLCPFLLPFSGWCARSCFPLSSIVPLLVALWWMVCEGLVSLCLPLCPFLLPFSGWCARSCFPLSSIVPLLVALWWMVCEGLVSLCLHCAPFCCALVDGVRGSCFPLSSIVPLLVALWWIMCEGLVSLCLPLCPFLLPFGGWCEGLAPFVFHCAPSCCALVDGVRGSCFPLSPIVPLLVALWWMVCEGLVSLCLPLYPFLLRFGGWCARVLFPFVSHCTSFCCALVDGVRGSCFPLSPIVPLHVALWWMVCEGLVSLCLPLCPFLLPFGGWCEGLVPFVFHCAPSCCPSGWCARVLSPFVFHCTPFCCPLVDGVRGSPIVPLLVAVWWMVCEGLVSLCLPLYPFLLPFVGWCVRLPEALPSLSTSLSPSLSPKLSVSLCRSLSPSLFSILVPSLSPSLSSFLLPFVGWCVRLSGALPPLSPTLSPSLSASLFPSLSPSWSPIVSQFPRPCPPCRLVSHFTTPYMCAFVGWCVRLPEALSPSLSSFLFSLLVHS